METLEQKVQTWVEAIFAEYPERYPDFFIVEIQYVSAKNQLKVYVDADSGVNIDHCTHLNRKLQLVLDEAQPLGTEYRLEVSSPGLSSPLKLHRQYLKNIGRNLSIELSEERGKVEGELVEVAQDYIVLSYEEKLALEGSKKKVLQTLKRNVPFADIAKALVQIRFK